MSLYTADELREKIKKIDEMLLDGGGIQSYSVSDGQGTQSVTKMSVSDLMALRKQYEAELATLDSSCGRPPYRVGVNF